ncbi:long-chain-fatty-acid--CoA ligase [Mycolicibacter senuensis]|uniref:Long-chain-fatty-acid--CoA ligase FadD13 n=1 Tax=Mycolicibacter senuensis TaxID=386913 RepID=A0A7I9XJ63_9MYCO|nr:long-chain-fatty-acid--CoA ligase [Mycolicibacter senuensis]ORW68675.1 fatty-acid--CoA ligase [Mycolicibacter senuensis]GFG69934.1 fatty-acid--CoA ligase [Mycolicibacter senuensis]
MYVTQGLHRALQQRPDATMIAGDGRELTFQDVARRVGRLAGGLRELGVRAGDRVAMLSLNSQSYHEYLLAVPWADAVLNPLNIRWSPAEISYALTDSATNVLFIDRAHRQMLAEIRAACPHLSTVIYCGDDAAPVETVPYEQLINDAAGVPDARRGGDQLAGVFYTGGTTGEPKGVMLSHAAIMTSWLGAAASGYMFRSRQLSRCLHAAPMFHLAGLTAWGVTTLLGATHVIVPRFEVKAVLAAVESHRVTDTGLVPTMVQAIVDGPDLSSYDLSSLRGIFYGGSAIPKALLERASAALPEVAFTQAYGMTELAPIATLLGPEDHASEKLLPSAGRAALNCEVRIVDEAGAEVPRGSVGEIIVRGGNVMLGYWNKPAATAAAIRHGWLHTGDGGRMDEDGYLFVVDRIKDMIVTGGENVYSVEVENAVARNPAVAQCAVIGVPDTRWGERVHAVVVLQPGASATGEDIRADSKRYIAGYKAPRSVEFVEALPTSAAGKVLKRELRRQYRGGAACPVR